VCAVTSTACGAAILVLVSIRVAVVHMLFMRVVSLVLYCDRCFMSCARSRL
jgi:hypothetical protein